MSLPLTADDKIEALVGLVLQAVDQRMTTVREQLIELNNTVARRHTELQDQIAECREMIAAAAGADSTADAGAAQLLQAANMLTERVTFLESRVNQYTDDRIAELRRAFEQMPSATPPPSAHLTGGVGIGAVNSLAPGISQLGSLAAVPSRSPAPSAAPISAPVAVTAPALTPLPKAAVVAAAAVTPATLSPAAAVIPAPAVAAPATAGPPAVSVPAADEFDIDAFTAQFNARLSALVERAIDA